MTEQAQKDLSDAAAAKDDIGCNNVFKQDRAYFVDANTKAKLIGCGSGLLGAAVYHVRIESGPHTEEDGWVPMEWMKK